MPTLAKVLNDLFTDASGETIAIGRVYSIPVLITGLAIPLIQAVTHQPISLTDLGIELGGTGGACLMLIAGSARVDEPTSRTPNQEHEHSNDHQN